MNRVLSMLMLMFVIVCFGSFFSGCSQKNERVIRIHIRANSNEENDQEIKLVVRDSVIEFITPLIASCNNSDEVKDVLLESADSIENIADTILKNNGYNYKSVARISNEYFPSRSYGETVFPADYYDALIVELGSGSGDNWWCVAYPPLCFIGEDLGSNEIKYQSKLLELVEKFFGF